MKRLAAALLATVMLYAPVPKLENCVYAQEETAENNQLATLKKNNYNIALMLDREEDPASMRKFLESNLGAQRDYPYTTIKQSTLEKALRQEGIDKDLFIQNPLEYGKKLRKMNIDVVLVYWYSSIGTSNAKNLSQYGIKADYNLITKFSMRLYDMKAKDIFRNQARDGLLFKTTVLSDVSTTLEGILLCGELFNER